MRHFTWPPSSISTPTTDWGGDESRQRRPNRTESMSATVPSGAPRTTQAPLNASEVSERVRTADSAACAVDGDVETQRSASYPSPRSTSFDASLAALMRVRTAMTALLSAPPVAPGIKMGGLCPTQRQRWRSHVRLAAEAATAAEASASRPLELGVTPHRDEAQPLLDDEVSGPAEVSQTQLAVPDSLSEVPAPPAARSSATSFTSRGSGSTARTDRAELYNSHRGSLGRSHRLSVDPKEPRDSESHDMQQLLNDVHIWQQAGVVTRYLLEHYQGPYGEMLWAEHEACDSDVEFVLTHLLDLADVIEDGAGSSQRESVLMDYIEMVKMEKASIYQQLLMCAEQFQRTCDEAEAEIREFHNRNSSLAAQVTTLEAALENAELHHVKATVPVPERSGDRARSVRVAQKLARQRAALQSKVQSLQQRPAGAAADETLPRASERNARRADASPTLVTAVRAMAKQLQQLHDQCAPLVPVGDPCDDAARCSPHGAAAPPVDQCLPSSPPAALHSRAGNESHGHALFRRLVVTDPDLAYLMRGRRPML